jgi:hypothetical protein
MLSQKVVYRHCGGERLKQSFNKPGMVFLDDVSDSCRDATTTCEAASFFIFNE